MHFSSKPQHHVGEFWGAFGWREVGQTSHQAEVTPVWHSLPCAEFRLALAATSGPTPRVSSQPAEHKGAGAERTFLKQNFSPEVPTKWHLCLELPSAGLPSGAVRVGSFLCHSRPAGLGRCLLASLCTAWGQWRQPWAGKVLLLGSSSQRARLQRAGTKAPPFKYSLDSGLVSGFEIGGGEG